MALGIKLLDHAESAELALISIKIAVVVGIATYETAEANPVIRLNPFNHMDREWKPGYPGPASALIIEGEARGGSVLKARFVTLVVADLEQQLRLLRALQSKVPQQ